jgi:beta-glucosidase-like glycosyl hydrolase
VLRAVQNNMTDVRGDHEEVVRDVATRGTVLLKNVNGTLPLKKPRSIVIIGGSPFFA